MIWIFLKGVGVGLAVAVPFGPISVLCLRQTIMKGRLAGLAGGLGVALADGFYALLAALGFLLLAEYLGALDFWLRLFAGLFILWIAVTIAKSRPPEKSPPVKNRTLAANFIATFLLTLANPTTILTFVALFSGTGLAAGTGEKGAGLILTLGAFSGSLAWWIFLTEVAARLRHRVARKQLVWINRIAGFLLAIFGITILFQLVINFL